MEKKTSLTPRTVLIRIALWLPAAAWYGLIWFFSSQTGDESTDVSNQVITGALRFDIYALDWDFYQFLSFLVRKAGHMFIFFVLTGLITLALWGLLRRPRVRDLVSIGLCALLAAGDELHQFFVPGRSCMLRDVIVDLAGGAVFLLFFWLVRLLWRRAKARKGEKQPT